FLLGFGLKSAIVPFHSWLPDAHPSAPAPISAMLSGVLVKSLGIYALVRIMFNIFGATAPILRILVILGIISMVVGGLLALYQKDLKRLLAYSTVSQVGYIIFAFGLGTPLGIFAGLFHLVNHAVAKTLLFLNSGSIVYSTKERDLEKLGGLKEKMPVTAATSLIGAMSISGIPPVGGFWSKLVIILAAVNAKHFTGAFIAILISVITLAYYLKLQKLTFFGKLNEKFQNIKESPVLMCISMIMLAGICIFLGLVLLPGIKEVFLDPAVNVLQNGVEYSRLVFENIK
ncbi:MAG: complex I subunit 5 family protein, partial [Endomicrobiia bacterium]